MTNQALPHALSVLSSKATKHNGSIINSRRGSRENGDHFSITEKVKMRPSNEGGGGVREHIAPEKRLGFNPVKCHSLLLS